MSNEQQSPDRVAQAALIRQELAAIKNPEDMSSELMTALVDIALAREFRFRLSFYAPPPAERVLEWIMHPEPSVRAMAVRFFNGCRSCDERVMPQVIRTLEKYGETEDFRGHLDFAEIAQTPESLGWLIRTLDETEPHWSTYERALVNADVKLLRSQVSDVLRVLADIGSDDVEFVKQRLRFAEQDFPGLWRQLEELTMEYRDAPTIEDIDLTRGTALVEALARFPDQAEARAGEVLRGPIAFEGAEELLRVFALKLAGWIRSDELVPIIAGTLISESDWFVECAEAALTCIGSDATVDAVYSVCLRTGDALGIRGGWVLENIHSARSVATARTLHELTDDAEVRTQLASAMLHSFAPIAVEIAQTMLREGDWEPGLLGLDEDLITVATALELPIDDPDTWPEVQTEMTATFDRIRAMGKSIEALAGRQRSADDDFDDYRYDDAEDDVPPPAAQTIHRKQPKVGRNDPCPCGSGKKYKKCCMQSEQSLS
ncbi:MAG: SEC-C metal-binding domain-containing protein [Planctomycetaceae bacterium]